MDTRHSRQYHIEVLEYLIYDHDANDFDPTWRPELLASPRMAAHPTCSLFLLLGYHKDLRWHGMGWDDLRGVRHELVNWNRRIIMQGVEKQNANVATWYSIHASRVPEYLLEIAADEDIFILDGGYHEVRHVQYHVVRGRSFYY